MNNYTSYISEHTSEYVLIPALKSILLQKYKLVTPIFPWISREGGRISKAIHGDEKYFVVGLYPRRPKLKNNDDTDILIKINRELLGRAKAGIECGIPMIAGCPLARSFQELGDNPEILWVELTDKSSEEIRINMKKDLFPIHRRGIFPSQIELLEYIENQCKLLSLTEMIEAFRTIKMYSHGIGNFSQWAYIGGYKPVYFLMMDK